MAESSTRLIDRLTRKVMDLEASNLKIVKSLDDTQARLSGEIGHPERGVIDKAFNPMRLSGASDRGLLQWGGQGNISVVDMGDAYKVPHSGRSKSLGYEDVWRAMYASHDNAAAQRVGWTANDPPPRQFIEQKGFKSPSKRWGKHKASLAEGQGFTGGYAVP